MSLVKDLLETPPSLSTGSKYTVMNGIVYLFGGRSGSRQFVAASVVDRLVLVPAVLVPLAMTGVFPHLLITFAILDPLLGVGAWLLLHAKTRSDPRGAAKGDCR